MAAGLLSGLGMALQGFGGAIAEQDKEARMLAAQDRKQQLAAKLQMDILKAKQAFMQTNPQYKHYITTPSGSTIGFDQFGNPRTVNTPTEADSAILAQKLANEGAYKQAQVAGLLSQVGQRDPNNPLVQSEITKNNAAAAKYDRSTPKTPKDASVVDPIRWNSAKSQLIQQYIGKKNYEMLDPSDPDDAKTLAAADAKADAYLRSQGIRPGVQAGGLVAPNLGPFGSLVPQQQGAEEVPDEEPDEDDLE